MTLNGFVSMEEWCVSETLGYRRERLLNVPPSEALLERVIVESDAAALAGQLVLQWEHCKDRPNYARVVAQIPLAETTFDQFFNGRSGYRAQYYLSQEQGNLYNRETLNRLVPAIEEGYRRHGLEIEWDLIKRSLAALYSKVWVFKDKNAFEKATPRALTTERWVSNWDGSGMRCRAPLPDHCKIDVKGTFIHPSSLEFYVAPEKLDRADDLFNKGYS